MPREVHDLIAKTVGDTDENPVQEPCSPIGGEDVVFSRNLNEETSELPRQGGQAARRGSVSTTINSSNFGHGSPSARVHLLQYTFTIRGIPLRKIGPNSQFRHSSGM